MMIVPFDHADQTVRPVEVRRELALTSALLEALRSASRLMESESKNKDV